MLCVHLSPSLPLWPMPFMNLHRNKPIILNTYIPHPRARGKQRNNLISTPKPSPHPTVPSTPSSVPKPRRPPCIFSQTLPNPSHSPSPPPPKNCPPNLYTTPPPPFPRPPSVDKALSHSTAQAPYPCAFAYPATAVLAHAAGVSGLVWTLGVRGGVRVEWIDGALGTWCGLGVGVRGVGGGMGGCLILQILLRGRRGEGGALRFCIFWR